jgi:catechol 2,3-dioxygenase-like lactoylglutathione lyase family enzyme
MVPARLNVTTLVTRDVQARRRFYEQLGWRSMLEPRDDFARLGTSGAHLTLWTREEAEAEIAAPLRAAGHEFRDFTLAIAVERREEVDAALDAARQAGATIVAEATDPPFGGRSGYFVDPEGAPWEVVWIPGTSLDERGGLTWPRP